VQYNNRFENHISAFLGELDERASHYILMSEQLENNPLLSIDYLKRAYLLTGNRKLHNRALKIYASAGLENRAKNSLETVMTRSW
jgi:hypothetical protein